MAEHSGVLSPIEAQKRGALKLAKPRVYKKVIQYADKIKRGESIAIIQFQYDYRCNFRCQHCCTTKITAKERFFTPGDIRELSRQADEMGWAHWVITGGEPLTFPDFDQIVAAIDPNKFYITSDTNGWLLDENRAKHLKTIGVDKIQLSLDSLNAEEHDAFRRAKGSHKRGMQAIGITVPSKRKYHTLRRIRQSNFISGMSEISASRKGNSLTSFMRLPHQPLRLLITRIRCSSSKLLSRGPGVFWNMRFNVVPRSFF